MELYFTEKFEKNLDLDSISVPSNTDLESWSDEQLMKAFLTDRKESSKDVLHHGVGDELFNRDIGIHQIQGQEAFFYSPPTNDVYVWTTKGFDKSVGEDETQLPDSKPLEDWSSDQLMKAYFFEVEKDKNVVDGDIGGKLWSRDIGAHHMAGQLVFLEST